MEKGEGGKPSKRRISFFPKEGVPRGEAGEGNLPDDVLKYLTNARDEDDELGHAGTSGMQAAIISVCSIVGREEDVPRAAPPTRTGAPTDPPLLERQPRVDMMHSTPGAHSVRPCFHGGNDESHEDAEPVRPILSTDTTDHLSAIPIEARLVEQGDDAPWKEEMALLKRELEELKQSQARNPIVHAEPVVLCAANSDDHKPTSLIHQPHPAMESQPSQKLTFASILYGRQAEAAKLRQALNAVSSSKQLVLISGGSGVGKSALTSGLQAEPCHYISGKFDLNHVAQPYSAIADACDQLCQDLLLYKNKPESPYPYGEFRSKIPQFLDQNDTDLLQAIIPTLQRMVGESVENHDIKYEYTEIQHRFQHAFKGFIKVLASFDAPLVLALDDLQWVDQPSLDLLTSLLVDTEVPPFLLATCCRDNEVDESHIFFHALETWKTTADQLNITDVPVNNLPKDDVSLLLQDLLGLNQEVTQPLADCVHSKTAGNPFYMRQFLLSLVGQGMLTHDGKTKRWHYDLPELRRAAKATENVATLLAQKLEHLPLVVRAMLPRIACLGCRFNQQMAHIAMENPVQLEPNDVLQTCEKEGLITECGDGWFKWEHDKVMEAALLQVEHKGKLSALKSELGWLLYDKLSTEELSSNLFIVTSLINSGLNGKTTKRSAELVELNLRSGKKALEASAFAPAAEHLQNGIMLLPANKWQSQIDLTLDLYCSAAEVQYCVGDFEKALEYCSEVQVLSSSPLCAKYRAYTVRMHALAAQGEVAETMLLTKEILKKLGVKFPSLGRGLLSLSGMLTMARYAKKTVPKLECLKLVEDQQKCWTIYFLERLMHWTYLYEPDLLPLVVIKLLEWTVKCGRTDHTAPCLASIALILAGSVGDFAGGKKYADLAIKYMNTSVASKTLFFCYQFVYHYQIPTKECLLHLEQAHESGMKSGDVESALWASSSVLEGQLHTGSPLPQMLLNCELFSRRTRTYNQEVIGWCVQPCWQLVANLINKDSNKHVLTGEHMNEDEFKEKIKEHAHYHHQLSRYKICAAFWFNEHEVVVQLMEEFGYHNFSIEKATPGTNGIGSLYFQCAMSCVALAREDKKKHAVQKKRAKKFLGKQKEWVNKGNPNVQHYEALLEAELSSLSGKASIVTAKHYNYAILLADELDFPNDHGLAHEKFGDHCLRQEDMNGAMNHYQAAMDSFSKWGALAKVATLNDLVQSTLTKK